MPQGWPAAPSVQTVTDKLATISPTKGNVAGYYVWLVEPDAADESLGAQTTAPGAGVYGPSSVTDAQGNWSIPNVPASKYVTFFGARPERWEHRGKSPYLVALNPLTNLHAWADGWFDVMSPANPSGVADNTGTADATAAIQAAINAAQASPNGVAWLPAGTYKLTSQLNFSRVPGWRFLGAGRNVTTLKQATDNTPILNLGNDTVSTCHSFKIDGMSFDYANSQPSTNTNAIPIKYSGPVFEGSFTDLKFERGSYAMQVVPGQVAPWGCQFDRLLFNSGLTKGAINETGSVTGLPGNTYGHMYIVATNMVGPIFVFVSEQQAVVGNVEIDTGSQGPQLFNISAGCHMNIGAIHYEGSTYSATQTLMLVSANSRIQIGQFFVSGMTATGAGVVVTGINASGGTLGNLLIDEVDVSAASISSGAVAHVLQSNSAWRSVIGALYMANGWDFADAGSTTTQNWVKILSHTLGALSDDKGDADATVALGDPNVISYETPITADRTVNLPSVLNNNHGGLWYRVVRATTCTGAFNILVKCGGTTKATLSAAGSSAELTYRRHPSSAASGWVLAVSPPPGTDASPIRGVITEWGNGRFNVMSPSNPSGAAVGDGSADDTASIQAAINAAAKASGKVIFPGTLNNYKVTSTLTIQPQAGGPSSAQVYMDIECDGQSIVINWQGGNSTAVFQAFGWKHSSVRGVKISLPATATGVIGWDLDVDGTRTSTAQLSFYNCLVTMVNGAASCVGWRMGHAGGAAGEMSFIDWHNCHANGGNNANSNIGWADEHANGLNYNWYGGSGLLLGFIFTNQSTAGAASAQGGDSKWFHGLGGSTNNQDFQFRTVGAYGIFGGRFESGKILVGVTSNNARSVITVKGIKIATYAAASNTFDLAGAVCLILDGIHASGSVYTNIFVRFYNSPTSPSQVIAKGCQIRGADPFWSNGGATAIEVSVEGCAILNSSDVVTGWMQTRLGAVTALQTPTEAVLVSGIDPTLGSTVKVTLTAARVVGLPTTRVAGRRYTFVLVQGGAGGFAVTWNAAYKLTWADTGNTVGKQSMISFVDDATNMNQDGAQVAYL